MSEHNHHGPLPRAVLWGAGALIALSLVLATSTRLNGVGATQMPESVAVSTLDIRVADHPDGSVVFYDAADNREAAVFAPGTNGFVRGVMRGLARERRRDGIGAAPPFRLTRWADGRLSLQDPSTGIVVNLEVFGATNAAVFANLFAPGAAPDATAATGLKAGS